ncbi:MAG: radical SAM protein [Planctomycetes bacterium]|nr:radical SAM protein [Planctomycetota bacterium]
MPVRHALVRPDDADRTWCDWSADPYQGCGFGCVSCMARNARVGGATTASGDSGRAYGVSADADRERPEGALQHPLYVKSCFPEALRRDLVSRVRTGEHIAFGVTTDPYQRAERHECLTRATLRELTRVSGLRISITTKSTMVTRDLDLLVQVAARNAVQVNLAMTTSDARLARVLEPHLPTPAGSLAALREIRAAGLRAGVFLLPVLPGITDAEPDLRALVVAARDAGAQFVAHRTSFVDTAARSHFLAVLRRAYPRVAARHELWTRCGPSLPRDVREQISARVQAIAQSCGLPAPAGEHPPTPVVEVQRRFEFAS